MNKSITNKTEIQELYTINTRWLYCVECARYSLRLEVLGYLIPVYIGSQPAGDFKPFARR